MEVLQERVVAKCTPTRNFKALLVNFKKLQTSAPDPPPTVVEEFKWQDMLHAVAGLCSVALPDMEESAIYSSITRSGSKTIILTNTDHQQQHSPPPTSIAIETTTEHIQSHNTTTTANITSSDSSVPMNATNDSVVGLKAGDNVELENSFQEIFSASDTSDTESVGDDEFSEGRRRFLEACRLRRKHQQLPRGPEETIAGCGCFLRLSDRPHSSAVQIILLVVRHRWRRSGLGSFLLQTMKDPAVVGGYDALLTFADHKAERFFTTHGFSDDPILAANYRVMVDHWENSSLMTYIPPFSVLVDGGTSGDTNSSVAALSLCEDSFMSWRESTIATYCRQLSLMQRLRHEVVLLHSKLESCKSENEMLTKQLEQARRDKSNLDLEFANYRKQTQKLLCEATVDRTKQWLQSLQNTS